MSSKRAILIGLLLFLLFPYLILVGLFPKMSFLEGAELWWALKNTVLQSVGSAVLSVAFAVLGAFALIRWPHQQYPIWRRALEVHFALAGFLPSLFLLLSLMNIFDPFLVGIPGIIIVHAFAYWGVIAIGLAKEIEQISASMVETAFCLGAGRYQIFKELIWVTHRRSLLGYFFYAFSLSFISFAVPLSIGGGRGTTIEVLIYEKIRIASDWGPAVFLSLFQSVFIYLITYVRPEEALHFFKSKLIGLFAKFSKEGSGNNNFNSSKNDDPDYINFADKNNFAILSRPNAQVRALGSSVLTGLMMGIAGLPILGYFEGVWDGLQKASMLIELRDLVIQNIFVSIAIGTATGLLSFGILYLLLFCYRELSFYRRFISRILPPSTALAGFALLVFLPNNPLMSFLKITLGLCLLSMPFVFRMGYFEGMDALKNQSDLAETYGANESLVAKKILFPQMAAKIGNLSGYIAVWAVGDFALSRILAHSDLSLAMTVETLMSSYRTGLATGLSLLLIPVAGLCFILVKGAVYVLSQRA